MKQLLLSLLMCLMIVTLVLGLSSCNKTKEDSTLRLFTHLSTDESSRVQKALGYSLNQLNLGVKLFVWLDCKGVRVADSTIPEFHNFQTILTNLVNGGATVMVCPLGMMQNDVNEINLVEGMWVGGSNCIPEMNEKYLFKSNTAYLSW